MTEQSQATNPPGTELVAGIFALTSSESKRLIAKGVAAMPSVKRVLQKGRLIISVGTTNAFIVEEILGREIPKGKYAAGIVTHGSLTETTKADRMLPFVLKDGKVVDTPSREMLEEFEASDIFIKGANAIDPFGNVGIYMGNPIGGTIGTGMGIVMARGAELIVPVGLEKMIPSVTVASCKCGIGRFKYYMDEPVGYMPLVNANVVTEIEALRILTGVTATHCGSGGIGGSEGAVALIVEGADEQVARTFELIKSVKGEPPVSYTPTA